MDILAPLQLVKRDMSAVPGTELQEGRFIGLYFGAHWCTACREFTPQLRSVWSDLQDTGRDLKVVVISLDRTEPDMMEFLEETKTYWPAVQFADDACGKLMERFSIVRVPSFVVLDSQGTLVCPFGRDYIEAEGLDVWERWIRQSTEG